MISEDLAAADRRTQERYAIGTWVRIGSEFLEREQLSRGFEDGRVVGYLIGEIYKDAPRTEPVLAVLHERDDVRRYWPSREIQSIPLRGPSRKMLCASDIVELVESQQ